MISLTFSPLWPLQANDQYSQWPRDWWGVSDVYPALLLLGLTQFTANKTCRILAWHFEAGGVVLGATNPSFLSIITSSTRHLFEDRISFASKLSLSYKDGE